VYITVLLCIAVMSDQLEYLYRVFNMTTDCFSLVSDFILYQGVKIVF